MTGLEDKVSLFTLEIAWTRAALTPASLSELHLVPLRPTPWTKGECKVSVASKKPKPPPVTLYQAPAPALLSTCACFPSDTSLPIPTPKGKLNPADRAVKVQNGKQETFTKRH